MTATVSPEAGLQAMMALQAGITNIRLYPPSSAIVIRSVEKLQSALEAVLQSEGTFTVAESGGQVLLQSRPLPEAERKKPQVDGFIQLLKNLGVASLTVEAGVGTEELLRFLEVAGSNPRDLKEGGGLRAALAERPLPHIRLNERVFVELGAEDLQEIASKSNMEELTRFLMGDATDETVDSPNIQELAANPKLIARVLHLGLERIEEKQSVTSERLMADSFGRMIRNVDNFADGAARSEVARRSVQAMAELDPDVFVSVISRNVDELLDKQLLAPLLQQIDDDRYVALAGRLEALVNREAAGRGAGVSIDTVVLSQAVAAVAGSERGRSLQQQIRTAAERDEAQRHEKAERLKIGLAGILKGERKHLADPVVMRSLPETVAQLYTKGKPRTAEQILDRIYEGLALEGTEVQAGCAAMAEATVELLESDCRLEAAVDVCHRLLEWTADQEAWSVAFERVAQLLARSARSLAGKGKGAEVAPVAETFQAIADGRTPRPEEIRRVVRGLEAELPAVDSGEAEEEATPAEPSPGSPVPPDSPGKEAKNDRQRVQDEAVREAAEGRTENAVRVLYEAILRYAEAGDFSSAETLRETLLEVDPMALTEIVKTGEIIEDAKSSAIDDGFRRMWSGLFEALSPEESNRFYHDLESAAVEPDRELFRQGRYNDRLYFVEEGQLKLIYRRQDRDLLLQMLDRGDMAGVDTFFSHTVCTTSLITLTEVRLKSLSKRKMARWQENFPGLESTLRDFCRKRTSTADLLKKKGLDRRAHRRVPVSGTIECRLLAPSGEPGGKPFKGELSDLSAGGLSLYIRTAKEEAARKLLGRSIEGRFALPGGEGSGAVKIRGAVIGVHYHLQNDYSLHVKFRKPLPDRVVDAADTGKRK